MISVENFYWTLFDNLLNPAGLDAWYYAPFGTKDTLVQNVFRPQVIKESQHVLFHFDQEPIYEDDLGWAYEQDPYHHNSKVLRVLANSEKSDIKKKICRDRAMSDWYFFYHGFAALDWFRDLQYIGNRGTNFDQVYLSFNHLVRHKRSYRMSLMARLVKHGLVQFGNISFHGTSRDCWEEINDAHTQLSRASQDLIYQYLCDSNTIPSIVDSWDINGSWSARLGHTEYQLWQGAFLHVVPETIFYDDKLHLTEKIFKPIVAHRPFILVAAPNNLAYLREYGFKTFHHWIDESYDSVIDPDQRLDLITQEIARLCRKSHRELRDIYTEMIPVLEHNKRHFFGEFKQIIVDEMVDNFDCCLRQWNNGRVDGKNIPVPLDLAVVKHILSN